jgi:hypothetical protein
VKDNFTPALKTRNKNETAVNRLLHFLQKFRVSMAGGLFAGLQSLNDKRKRTGLSDPLFMC